ncbi:MMPL family transporter [Cellulomonas sp. PhB143]|uniref:MMPL family transporter n=1 Tax=Cellulomonas sp. PhB143 TaxID=2485186 RepID=UPI000FA5C11B|nr:MMPL family transporter [Cellulomonas sp. PhB143]ROS74561.1 RND superfamily putative drug exporter [Cellulomonas sp. PhB143]
MLETLGRRVARRPRTTVVVWAVLAVAGFALALLGVQGQNLFDRITTGEPTVPGSQSAHANELVSAGADDGESITLLVDGVDPADADVATVMSGVADDLRALDGVDTVIDPYVLPEGLDNPAAASLLAKDGHGFVVEVTLDADLDDDALAQDSAAVVDRLDAVDSDLQDVAPGATGLVGSNDLIVEAITGQVQQDLRTGEAVALPVALVIMVLVFGGFLAAAMPLVGAIASIGAGLGVLFGMTYWFEVDASVVNVVTLLGLGLSVDYGLLVVSRYREELHAAIDGGALPPRRRRRGDDVVHTALERTMGSAGRTVAFSALIVAISIAGLTVFSPDILRSIGAAGCAVVVIAAATALTLVPALLVLSGRRLARPGALGRVPGLRRLVHRTSDVTTDVGAFSRLAGWVQRRRWPVLVGSVALLVLLALPLLGLQMRNTTIALLPADAPQREFVETLDEQYAPSPELFVVTDSTPEAADAWAADVEKVDGVDHVSAASATAPGASTSVVSVYLDTDDAGGAAAEQAVRDVRALDAPFETWVGGQAAGQIDFVDAMHERVWWALGIVVIATFVLLLLMTGSVVIPVQALVTNALSLAASLGVLVLVFQDGHLSGLLGFDPVGGIETYVVALVVAFAFGLATDYEVFLLSRVKELHDAGVGPDEAVRAGLQRSGRIITSAAAIIVVVFAGFVAGDLLVIKEVGFALAVAVLVDATLVRLLLVPATLTVLGRTAWWAPAPVRRLTDRVALRH